MASEIRVNKINSRTGVGTITLSPTGVDFTGIATVATLKATTGIVTTLTTTGNATVGGNIDLADNSKIKLGTGDDLEIYHDGSESYIADEGTGGITISGGLLSFKNQARDETHATMSVNGSVDLYYDNNKKFETKSDGIDVTGEVQCDSLDVDGNADITGNLSITESGTDKALRLRYPGDSSNSARTTFEVTASVSGSETAVATIKGDGSASFGTDSPFSDAQLTVGNGGSGNASIAWRRTGSGENDWAFSNQGGELKVLGGGDATAISGLSEKVRFQSAGGISFNGDSAAANALDDYEEGDWTPAMNSGGWTSFTVNTAKYVKIGGQVFVQCYVSALQGSGTGNVLKLQGLPYLPIQNGYTVGSVDMGEGSVKGTYCRTESNTNQISFLYPSESNSAARVTLKGNQIGDAYIIIGLTYYTNY